MNIRGFLAVLLLACAPAWPAVDLSDRTISLTACPGFPGLYGGDCPEEILFQTNFDDTEYASGADTNCYHGGDPDCSTDPIPGGWDHWFLNDAWHPDTDSGSQEVVQFTSSAARGGSGRGFVMYDESWGAPSSWGAEGQLLATIDPVSEVWLSMYIRFPTDYRLRSDADVTDITLGKMFRVGHYFGDPATDSYFSFFTTGNNGPIWIFDLVEQQNFAGDTRGLSNYRCTPIDTDYECPDGEKNHEFVLGSITRVEGDQTTSSFDDEWDLGIGDGNWHELEARVVMNTSPGTADGIVQVYVDGELEFSITDIEFVTETETMVEWNWISVGGNWQNVWVGTEGGVAYSYPAGGETGGVPVEQPVYYDDVMVCRSRCVN